MSNFIQKTLKKTEEYYIEFSDEELSSLNIKKGDKFTIEQNDGELLLKKFVSVDVDISEWDRSILEFLVTESIETDTPVNDVICRIIERQIEKINED